MQDDMKCPRCPATETTTHALMCNGYGADDTWMESEGNLSGLLDELETCPQLKHFLLENLRRWRTGEAIEPTQQKQTLTDLCEEQNLIGWRNLLEGMASKQWAHIQQRHYNRIGSRRSGKKWIEQVSKQLRWMAFKQWQHRNEVKHRLLRPRHQQEEQELDAQITQELAMGPADLPVGDHHHFNFNATNLCRRNLTLKQSWIANITAARERQYRKRTADDDATNLSQRRSKLLHWIQTGRAS